MGRHHVGIVVVLLLAPTHVLSVLSLAPCVCLGMARPARRPERKLRPTRTHALAALTDQLTATQTTYPGTDLTPVYTVNSP